MQENAATPPRHKQAAPPSLGESPLFPQYQAPASVYEAPSDTESEMEDAGLSMDAMRKEELFQRYKNMERSLGKYKGRYKEVSMWDYVIWNCLFHPLPVVPVWLFNQTCFMYKSLGKILSGQDSYKTSFLEIY